MLWRAQDQWQNNPSHAGPSQSGAWAGGLPGTKCNVSHGPTAQRSHSNPPADKMMSLFPHEVIERDSRRMLEQDAGNTGIPSGIAPLAPWGADDRVLHTPYEYMKSENQCQHGLGDPGEVATVVALVRSLERHLRSTTAEVEELRRMVITVEQRAEARAQKAEADKQECQEKLNAVVDELAQKLSKQQEQISEVNVEQARYGGKMLASAEQIDERILRIESGFEVQKQVLAGTEDHMGRLEAAAAAAATAAAEGCARALQESTSELRKEIAQIKSACDAVRHSRPALQTLTVTLVGADGLPSKDGWANGLPDPYAVCRIVGQEGFFRTPTAANSVSPSWNHIGNLANFGAENVLEIQVWDRNTLRPDAFIGATHLTHSELHVAGIGKQLELQLSGQGLDATKAYVFVKIDAEVPAVSSVETDLGSIDGLAGELVRVQAQAHEFNSRLDTMQLHMSGLRLGASAEESDQQKQQALLWELESRVGFLEAGLAKPVCDVRVSSKDADLGNNAAELRSAPQTSPNVFKVDRHYATSATPPYFTTSVADASPSQQLYLDVGNGGDDGTPPPSSPLFGWSAPDTDHLPVAQLGTVGAPHVSSAGAVPHMSTDKLPQRLMSSLAAQKEQIQLHARTLEKSLCSLRNNLRPAGQPDDTEDLPPEAVGFLAGESRGNAGIQQSVLT